MKSILVTGSAGFIGSNLVLRLLEGKVWDGGQAPVLSLKINVLQGYSLSAD